MLNAYITIALKSHIISEATFSGVNTVNIENVLFNAAYGSDQTMTGHGIYAEEAGSMLDKLFGEDSTVVGRDNAKNGPDKIVNSVPIQCKYYKGAKKTVKCISCGTTHALIPKDAILYKQYSLSLVVLLFLIWADPSKKKNYQNIEVPNTSRRSLIFESKKDSALLLALTIERSAIQKNTNIFELPMFIVVCWEHLNKKFSENVRLNNLLT